MAGSPTLSIIIPAYNVESFIRPSVESALRQSWTDLEVIVVDDGSTDGTMEALRDIEDPRLNRVRTTHSGLASARNSGIQAASGAFIGLLDGDDLWAQTKAQRHLELLHEHPEVDLTFSNAWMMDASGRCLAPLKSYGNAKISFEDLFIECPHCSAVVRREAIIRAGLFDTSLRVFEDLDLWLRIALQREGNVCCIGEYLAFYRRRAGQLTEDWKLLDRAWRQLGGKLSGPAAEKIENCRKRANQVRYRHYAFLEYEKKRYREALRLLLRSLRQASRSGWFERSTWSLVGACAAGMLLPVRFHQFLRGAMGVCRSQIHR